MRLRHESELKMMLLWIVTAAFWMATTAARADHRPGKTGGEAALEEHVIAQGETLGEIAMAHGVLVEELMAANGIEDADKIFYGQRLKLPAGTGGGTVSARGVEIVVPKGFPLSRIAAAYGVSVKSVIRANRIGDPDKVREGSKILIPGVKRVIELVPPPPCYKDPIAFYRVRTDETLKLPLLYCSGRVIEASLEKLSRFSDPPTKPTKMNLHPRLATLLQRIADRYPGKRIEVISGQRTQKQDGNESYHNKGRALDFRVEGVSNHKLSQFIRTFTDVGVGYYPNSVFVHMDTRDTQAYWIDYSAPGERAIYGRKGMSEDEVEQIRAKRREKDTPSAEDLSAKQDAVPSGDEPTS